LTAAHSHPPGTLEGPSADAEYPAIATSDGWLCPVEVQPENRRAMSWSEYLRGARLSTGSRFVAPDPPRPSS
jgi:methionyl-tRNA formyltransferase